jgi:hypothetical protein
VDRTEVSVQIKFKRLGKKEGSYNKKHVDEKYKLNQRFFDVIRPETLLDMYCGEKDWWRGVVPVVTSNDSNKKINADYNEQAERLIHKLYYEGGRFDVIDLDPYGSAYECFDCAIKMAEKGLIVTFGEMGHKRFKRLDFVSRHYGIRSLEDFTIENLILEVEKIGRRNKKRITPILIGNWNRISRVYFKIERMVVMDKCGSFLNEDVFENQVVISESDVYQAILQMLAEKRACGDVLPYVTCEEVSQRLHKSESGVRAAVAKLRGIAIVRTEETECYYE